MKALPYAVALMATAAPALGQIAADDFPAAITGPALAAWLPAHTSLRLADVISVGGGRVVALTRRSAPAGAPGPMRITIRTEIVDRAAAAQAHARSETSELDIDCTDRKAKVVETQTYSQRDLAGTVRFGPGWDDWAPAAPNTTLDRMVTAACEPAFRGTFAPAPAAPQLRRASAPSPPAPRPRPPGPIAAQAKPPAASAAQAPGRFSSLVQISASISRAQAQASLDRLKAQQPQLVGDHPTLIEQTEVAGQTFQRALIGGFAGATEARAFCASLKAAGGDCIVRQR